MPGVDRRTGGVRIRPRRTLGWRRRWWKGAGGAPAWGDGARETGPDVAVEGMALAADVGRRAALSC